MGSEGPQRAAKEEIEITTVGSCRAAERRYHNVDDLTNRVCFITFLESGS